MIYTRCGEFHISIIYLDLAFGTIYAILITSRPSQPTGRTETERMGMMLNLNAKMPIPFLYCLPGLKPLAAMGEGCRRTAMPAVSDGWSVYGAHINPFTVFRSEKPTINLWDPRESIRLTQREPLRCFLRRVCSPPL